MIKQGFILANLIRATLRASQRRLMFLNRIFHDWVPVSRLSENLTKATYYLAHLQKRMHDFHRCVSLVMKNLAKRPGPSKFTAFRNDKLGFCEGRGKCIGRGRLTCLGARYMVWIWQGAGERPDVLAK